MICKSLFIFIHFYTIKLKDEFTHVFCVSIQKNQYYKYTVAADVFVPIRFFVFLFFFKPGFSWSPWKPVCGLWLPWKDRWGQQQLSGMWWDSCYCLWGEDTTLGSLRDRRWTHTTRTTVTSGNPCGLADTKLRPLLYTNTHTPGVFRSVYRTNWYKNVIKIYSRHLSKQYLMCSTITSMICFSFILLFLWLKKN